jgi:nucleotide-binding universal stress UspA family protein
MTMFENILVATDGSAGGQAATAYARQLASTFGAPVTVVPLAEMSSGSALTRDRDAARSIASEATRVGADVIVLGLARGRLGHHLLHRGVRDHLARSTHLPVMVPPMSGTPSTVRAPRGRPLAAGRGRLQHV